MQSDSILAIEDALRRVLDTHSRREKPQVEPEVREMRTRTLLGDGMAMQRVLPGDLPG